MKFIFSNIFVLCITFFIAPLSLSDYPHLNNPTLWSFGHDPYGSSVEVGESIIQDGAARIKFNRAARVSPTQNTWIELIYKAPEKNLANVKSVKITYQCSTALIVKFSQRDFGELGDGSYAHYQTLLPATDDWLTVEMVLSDFSRPAWTPSNSKDVGLIMENVSAIYFAPAIDDIQGGVATLNVRAVALID